MSEKALSFISYLVICITPLVAGCQHIEHTYHDIVLDGFSQRNYVEINRNLGAPVCVYGRLSIDSVHHSVHFALQPIEAEGIIDIGFSRIISGLSYERVHRDGMADGESHRVCGTIRDATPFRQCDHDRCKWYKLENAELQRGPPRTPIPVTGDSPTLSPRQVIRSISSLDGREVIVRGHLSFGSQTRQLWQSAQARRNLDFDECVTLINTEQFAPVLGQRNGGAVVVLGRARRDVMTGHVDYGYCNDVGIEIIRVIR